MGTNAFVFYNRHRLENTYMTGWQNNNDTKTTSIDI